MMQQEKEKEKEKKVNVLEGDYWIMQDCTYVAKFSYEDGLVLKRYLEIARKQNSSRILAPFRNGVKRKWNNDIFLERHPGFLYDFEPLEVQFKRDKVTMEGMEIFNQNIMLQSAIRLNYMAVGSGTSTTYANQQEMQSEVARASMDEQGFMNAEGLFLLWENVFDTLVPSFQCSEVGIFDEASGGTMAARALLGQPVSHDYGNDWLYVQFFISTMSS